MSTRNGTQPELVRRVQTLLRLLAPDAASARRAVKDTIAAAGQAQQRPSDPLELWPWLASFALSQLRPRADPPTTDMLWGIRPEPDFVALRRALNIIGPCASPFGQGPTDSALLVLVRTLSRRPRCALTLHTLYRLPAATGAQLLGMGLTRFEQLHDEGLHALHAILLAHAQRQIDSTSAAADQSAGPSHSPEW
jgi:hypothetical protein